ncbi:flavin-dependent thymidylate synthase [Synergistales bacterium]|nr:flavin-dependent thymidylate synthase [Synergistales bacterium]
MPCNVILLEHTPRPDGLVAAAARMCYSDMGARELVARVAEETDEARERFLAGLWKSGHHSPLEHASFTFGVDGLSRVASHQLVRHRMASFSQQSQRYVKMGQSGDAAVVTPPSISSNQRTLDIFRRQAEASLAAYEELCKIGVPAEDARFILPHGWETRLVFTMNARELQHFFALRLCRRAQWEIQNLARQMLKLVRAAAPLLFRVSGPSCVTGTCSEVHPCGRRYADMEDLLSQK